MILLLRYSLSLQEVREKGSYFWAVARNRGSPAEGGEVKFLCHSHYQNKNIQEKKQETHFKTQNRNKKEKIIEYFFKISRWIFTSFWNVRSYFLKQKDRFISFNDSQKNKLLYRNRHSKKRKVHILIVKKIIDFFCWSKKRKKVSNGKTNHIKIRISYLGKT